MDESHEQEGRPQSEVEVSAAERAARRAAWEERRAAAASARAAEIARIEEARAAERAVLTSRIEELFGAATKRFRAPPRSECEFIADFLILMRGIDKAPRPARPSWLEELHAESKAAWSTRQRKLASVASVARRFLAGLKFLSEELAHRADNSQKRRPAVAARRIAERDQIDELACVVEAALPIIDRLRDRSFDPVRPIAIDAQRAWALANDGDFPRSTNPGDPLVNFVLPALAAIEVNLSPATVSDILRGRRRTKGRAKT
ncbi:MAG: hypothetical protein ACREFQ_10270 [Stellaceae bacterium]